MASGASKKMQEAVAKRKADALAVLSKKAGNVAEICRAVGISRTQFYTWVKDDAEFAEAVKNQKESLKDFAESQLHKAIKKGAPWAICFFLKCQAKDRGYVERQEVSGPDGGPIHHALDELPEEALRALAGRGRRGTGTPPAD